VHFTLDASAGPDNADKLTLTNPIPAGLTLVPSSVRTDGTVLDFGNDGTIQVQATNKNTLHLEFDATVNALDKLPLGAETLVNEAKTDAHFPDGRTVHGRTDYPVTLAQVNQLNVTIVPQTKVPGFAGPGETITYTLTATAAPTAQTVTIDFAAPQGTTLYVNGQAVDSVSFESSGNTLSKTVTAVVADQAHLPAGLISIDATAHGTVVLASGLTATKDATASLSLAPIHVTLTPLDASSPIAPGQTIHYEAKADTVETAGTLVITVNPPLGTTAYGGAALTQEVDNTSSNTFDFALVVQDAADLKTLAIDCTAMGQATFSDGSTPSAQATSHLAVADPLTVDVSASVSSARPKDVFNYTISATSTVPATSFSVQDQVPYGLTVVASSVTDGGVVTAGSGGSTLVSWSLPGGLAVSLTFAVQVLDAAHLPHKITSVVDLATVAAVIFGQVDAHEARCTTQILQPYLITGLVYDVTYSYPAQDILLPGALANVPVQLYQNGNVVQTTATDASGTYNFYVQDPGSYVVVAVWNVNIYDSTANIVRPVTYIPNPQTVAIAPGSAATFDLQDFFMPATILGAAAQAMYDLHNLSLPIFGGAFGLKPTIFSFDTTKAEQFIQNLVASSGGAQNNPFTANDLSPPPGQTDPWWALARAIAVMVDAKKRFDSVLPLADDLGKTLALIAGAAACRKAAPKGVKWSSVSNIDPKKVEWIEEKFRQSDRVLFFTTTFALLGPLMDGMAAVWTKLFPNSPFYVTPQMKADIYEAFAVAERWGTNLIGNVGKLNDDILFEAVFDVVRYGLTTAIMSVEFGASLPILGSSASSHGSIKLALDQAQNQLVNSSYATSVDIVKALSTLSTATFNTGVDASGAHVLVSQFTYYLSIGRGLDAAYGINQGVLTAVGSEAVSTTILGTVRASFQRTFGVVMKGASKHKLVAATILGAFAGTDAYLLSKLVSQANDAAQMANHAFNADPNDPTKPA